MSEEVSRRMHEHFNMNPFRFQSVVWAPEKNGNGKVRFAVEPMIYISGAGWDNVDLNTIDNEFIIGLQKYIQLKEVILGYTHVGNSSEQIKNILENIWGKKLW